MGHTSVTITLGVYAHLYADDHSDAMAALGAMGQRAANAAAADNVVPLRAGGRYRVDTVRPAAGPGDAH